MHWRILMTTVTLACSSRTTDVGSRPLSTPVQDVPERPRIVAHRGASGEAPENTLAAFRLAWELGVESIELDVHATKDDQVVVMHDPTTKRTGGVDLAIADHTLAELATVDVGSWKHARFASERIPTLANVFAATPTERTVFVEIKSGPSTVPAVARAIRAAPPTIAVALQGYDAATLAALSRELPGIAAYWTIDPPMQGDRPLPYPPTILDEAKRHGFAGVALFHGVVTSELVDRARSLQLAVDVWTVNDAAVLGRWVADERVRWIETDRPERVPAR